MAKMGRPKKELDWDQLEKLCQIQCTAEEIAGWFGVSVDTVERRIKETHGVTFAEYFKKHSASGKISLRRTQYKMAETNPAMAIWLGKQYLDQKDHRHYENLNVNVDGQLSPELQEAKREMLERLEDKDIIDVTPKVINVTKED